MRKKYFELLRLQQSTHVRWWLIYSDMFELWLIPQLLQEKPEVFQHDAALPHFNSEVATFLSRQLSDRWTARGGRSTPRPSRSSDLTPLDIFLWVFVKDKVYIPPVPVTLTVRRLEFEKRLQYLITSSDKFSVWNRIWYRCLQGKKKWSTCWTRKGHETFLIFS